EIVWQIIQGWNKKGLIGYLNLKFDILPSMYCFGNFEQKIWIFHLDLKDNKSLLELGRNIRGSSQNSLPEQIGWTEEAWLNITTCYMLAYIPLIIFSFGLYFLRSTGILTLVMNISLFGHGHYKTTDIGGQFKRSLALEGGTHERLTLAIFL
ncbi:hypothetical protein ACJX0J_006770, partial [Zea mays]